VPTALLLTVQAACKAPSSPLQQHLQPSSRAMIEGPSLWPSGAACCRRGASSCSPACHRPEHACRWLLRCQLAVSTVQCWRRYWSEAAAAMSRLTSGMLAPPDLVLLQTSSKEPRRDLTADSNPCAQSLHVCRSPCSVFFQIDCPLALVAPAAAERLRELQRSHPDRLRIRVNSNNQASGTWGKWHVDVRHAVVIVL
jgi:hypothetical protein